MADKTWKAVERRIADLLGGERVGATGEATPDVMVPRLSGEATPDVTTPWLSVEVKTRKELPAWLWNAMAQACANAPEGTLPIVVLHEVNRRHTRDFVVMTLDGFREWSGEEI